MHEANANPTSYEPFLCLAVRTARMIDKPGHVALSRCIDALGWVEREHVEIVALAFIQALCGQSALSAFIPQRRTSMHVSMLTTSPTYSITNEFRSIAAAARKPQPLLSVFVHDEQH